MKRIKSNNRSGIAKVRIGEKTAEIIFKDNPDDVVKLLRKDVPKTVGKGEYFVVLNSDEDEVLSIRPANAICKAKFRAFAAKEGEVPAPRQHPGGTGTKKDGSKYNYEPYLAFSAILDLLGDHAGQDIAVYLRYLFINDGDGGTAIKGGGRNADVLESFLAVTGLMDDEIKFRDNLLPSMQKKILQKNRTFQVMIKAGYVDSFLEDIEADDEDVDEKEPEEVAEAEEEAKPSRKPATKQAPPAKDDGDNVEADDDDDEDEPPAKNGKKNVAVPWDVDDEDVDESAEDDED